MSDHSTQPPLYIFTGTNERVHCTTAYITFVPRPTLFTNNAAYKAFRKTSSLLSTLQNPKQNSTITIPKPTNQHNKVHYHQALLPRKSYKNATRPLRSHDMGKGVLQTTPTRPTISLQRTAKLSSRSSAWSAIAVPRHIPPRLIIVWTKRLSRRRRTGLWVELDGKSRYITECNGLHAFGGFTWTVKMKSDVL